MEQLAQEFLLDKTWVVWDIGNGEQARVGIDPFVGDNGSFVQNIINEFLCVDSQLFLRDGK